MAGTTTVATAPTTTPQTGAGVTSVSLQAGIFLDKKLADQKLKYPLDLNQTGSGKRTYIRFQSYDFSKVQKTNEIYNLGNNPISNLLGEVVTGSTSGVAEYKQIPYPDYRIDLYVPPGINVGYGANWGEASLGAIGISNVSTGNGILDFFGKAIGSTITSASQASLDAAAASLSNVPSFNASGQDLLGLATGLVFNDNKFSTFNGMKLRSFNYSFVLVARSKKEQQEIDRIINTFKIAMHPIGLTVGSSGIITSQSGGSATFNSVSRPPILRYPQLWTITYMIGSDKTNRFIPKTKFCALTNLNLNYTPNGVFTTLTDGAIPAIQMDMSFQETTALTGDQLINGSILNGSGEDGIDVFGSNVGVGQNFETNQGGTF